MGVFVCVGERVWGFGDGWWMLADEDGGMNNEGGVEESIMQASLHHVCITLEFE